MFTGLIRDQGEIRRIDQAGDLTLEIQPRDTNFPLEPGASIACSGICLTVTSITPGRGFTVQLSAETLRCTTAGSWKVGQWLNLEPSLKAGDPLGGHYVSGHVDGLAKAMLGKKSGDSTVWEFELPLKLARFLAPKGSVTLDGVSLTVNSVSGNRFTVNIVSHTAAVTRFGTLKAGDLVNLEIDLIARYVARLMEMPA
jgi:riboflavin synthase